MLTAEVYDGDSAKIFNQSVSVKSDKNKAHNFHVHFSQKCLIKLIVYSMDF